MSTGHPSLSSRPTPDRPALRSRSNWRTPPAPIPGGMPGGAGNPDRNVHTIVLTDVAMSARHDSQGQRRMRQYLYAMVRDVVQYVGFELESLPLTDTGDGLRLCVPLDKIQPTRIVDMFVLGLAARLRDHRQDVHEAARIRMRVAFDIGLIEPHLMGWTGNPLIRVARLIEAETLRATLRANDRLDLVAVVSDVFYEEVVRHGYGYIGPSCFQAVRVTVKEFDARAWQLTPGTAGMCGQCYSAAA
jgi:hypothetical protein